MNAKRSLINAHNKGRIGWRFQAMQTYLICTFLRSLENSFRTMTSGKKTAAIDMPTFEELFEPKRSGGDDEAVTARNPAAELERQMGWG